MFLGLFRRELDETQLVPAAQTFLRRVRAGKSEAEAAAMGNISEEELRRWKRDGGFRAALRRPGVKADLIILDEVYANMADPHEPPPPGASELAIAEAGWRPIG